MDDTRDLAYYKLDPPKSPQDRKSGHGYLSPPRLSGHTHVSSHADSVWTDADIKEVV